MANIGDIIKSQSKEIDPIVHELSLMKQLIKERGFNYIREASPLFIKRYQSALASVRLLLPALPAVDESRGSNWCVC